MSFKKVGIIGAGTMGSGIATSLGQQGVDVVLMDSTQEAVDRGVAAARKFYDRAAEKGKISPEDAAAALGRITATTELADMASAAQRGVTKPSTAKGMAMAL